ncbi:hypothetical protein KKG48_00070 [Patescibacteria group bacterium]|nr:hypothetical protein [Patescibacteria group bacterium]MCG2694724.1 hypothetical protein [Candidatus Parcubacteria bacterium]
MNKTQKIVSCAYEDIRRDTLIGWWNSFTEILEKQKKSEIKNLKYDILLKSGHLLKEVILVNVEDTLPLIYLEDINAKKIYLSIDEISYLKHN